MPNKDWNILVYLAGDNDLASEIPSDIEQILDGVQSLDAGAAVAKALSDSSKRETVELTITKQEGVAVSNRRGNANTGAPSTLKEFLNKYLDRDFHNCVVLWGHGTGWKDWGRGTSEYTGLFNPQSTVQSIRTSGMAETLGDTESIDELLFSLFSSGRGFGIDNATGDFIDSNELSDVLKSASATIGKKIDLVVFDACLMGNLEVAVQCAPYANYLIASVEKVPSSGIDYARFIPALANATTVQKFDYSQFSADYLRDHIVSYLSGGSQFSDSALVVNRSPDTPVSLSFFNLANIDSFTSQVFNQYVGEMSALFQDPVFRIVRDSAIRNTSGFGQSKDYIDLIQFIQNFDELAASVGKEVPDSVIEAADTLKLRAKPQDANSPITASDRISKGSPRLASLVSVFW